MSIFRRENDPPPQPAVPAQPARSAPRPPAKQKSTPSESTHIATGSKVVGKISGSADLVIDGVVEGEIHLESQVVVGPEGRVEGKILARSVEVGGKVLGNVKGVERVEVLATGSLEGDVLSPRVVIAEGAFFKGKVEMTDKVAMTEKVGMIDKVARPARPEPPKAGLAAGGSRPSHGDSSPAPGDSKPAPVAGSKPASGAAGPDAGESAERPREPVPVSGGAGRANR